MKFGKVIPALVVALSAVPAWADLIETTIPSADFSVPGTIGAFNYSVPAGSEIRQVGFGSALYSFPAASATFYLCFDSDPVLDPPLFTCLGLAPSETQFFLGSILLAYPDTGGFPLKGPLTLAVRCAAGPCPASYVRVGGDAHWTLGIEFLPPPAPPTSIPTLEQWVLWLLGTMLLLAAGFGLRSRRFGVRRPARSR